jgi:hypothetical protein
MEPCIGSSAAWREIEHWGKSIIWDPNADRAFKFTFELSDSTAPTPETRARSVSPNVDPPTTEITTSVSPNAQAGI